MKRRAIIIYCNNTKSGELSGPVYDYSNYLNFLCSPLGGQWKRSEILGFPNPTYNDFMERQKQFCANADYTFSIFTGHGGINDDRQYLEFKDKDVPLQKLITDAKRQTIIVDACRGYYTPLKERIIKEATNESLKSFSANIDTRKLFDDAVLKTEEGISVLFAAKENQSARDTRKGAAYLLSLLEAAETCENGVLSIKDAHILAIEILKYKYMTRQEPIILPEKRKNFFPLAVKKSINI